MREQTITLIEAPARFNKNNHEQLYLLRGSPTGKSPIIIIPVPGVSLPAPVTSPRQLKILHFNDCHGRLTKFTPSGTQPVFSRLAGFFHQIQHKHRDDPSTIVLVLSAGDDQIGSTYDHLLGTSSTPFHCHAPYRLYSTSGVDLSVIGNHDLDMGCNILSQAIMQDAQFPLLSANLFVDGPLGDWIFPAAIIVSKGVRIGVIGVSTAGQLHRPPHEQIWIADPLPIVHNLLPPLREVCDVVIVLSHLGYSLQASSAAVYNVGDVELAQSLPHRSIDLIVGGHTHHILNMSGLTPDNVVNGIPIVQAGSMGEFVGEVDIEVQEQGTYVSKACLHKVQDLPVDEVFEALYVKPLELMVEPLLTLPLGSLSHHPDLHSSSLQQNFATGETALANFFTDAIVSRCQIKDLQVDLAALDKSAIHCGLPEQKSITFGDCYEMMPYADLITLVAMNGAALAALVDDNVLRFQYPGRSNRYRGFFHFSKQLRYTIQLDNDVGRWRAVDVRFNGRPLAELADRRFLLATTSFARIMTQGWEKEVMKRRPLFSLAAYKPRDTDLFYREEIINFILAHGGINENSGATRDGRLKVLLLANDTTN